MAWCRGGLDPAMATACAIVYWLHCFYWSVFRRRSLQSLAWRFSVTISSSRWMAAGAFSTASGPEWTFTARWDQPIFSCMRLDFGWQRGDARGLGYGSALATALISFWAFFLLRSRMRPAPFFVACLFLALLAAAPFPLGYHFFQACFSMKHNRYGYALTALVMLESFLPQDDNTRKQRFLGGFSTGLACALLLFLKISYGFVALTFAAVSLPLRGGIRSRLAGIAAGFAAFSIPMMAYLRFDLPSQISQYELLARAQGHRISLLSVARCVYRDRLEIALVILLAALVISVVRSFAASRFYINAGRDDGAWRWHIADAHEHAATDVPLLGAASLLF